MYILGSDALAHLCIICAQQHILYTVLHSSRFYLQPENHMDNDNQHNWTHIYIHCGWCVFAKCCRDSWSTMEVGVARHMRRPEMNVADAAAASDMYLSLSFGSLLVGFAAGATEMQMVLAQCYINRQRRTRCTQNMVHIHMETASEMERGLWVSISLG